MSGIRRPEIDPAARELGVPPRTQVRSAALPLLLGGGLAVVPMPGGLLLLVVLAAVVFSVGFAISGLFRLYLTPGRLVVEEFLFWKSVRLDSLAGIQVIPGGTGGARIRLRDTTGGECEVSFGALSPAGLRRLISTLRGQLDEQPGVESAGGVSQVLTRYETGKWRKLD